MQNHRHDGAAVSATAIPQVLSDDQREPECAVNWEIASGRKQALAPAMLREGPPDLPAVLVGAQVELHDGRVIEWGVAP